MSNFRDWLLTLEIVAEMRHRFLSEAVGDDKSHFVSLAKMISASFAEIISRGQFPEPIKTAAQTMQNSTELEPRVLGGKIAAQLSRVPANDRDDVVQNTLLNLVRKLPAIIKNTTFADAKSVDPDDFASYISGLFQKDLSFKGSSVRRDNSNRRVRPETDVMVARRDW